MPTNAKSRAYKEKEFEAYVLWRSFSLVFKNKPISFLENYGVTDPLEIELLSIGTQQEFAERFGIRDLGTLTDWNKRIEKENLLPKPYEWAAPLTKNVIAALYLAILKDAKPDRVKLWFEIMGEKLSPKTKMEFDERLIQINQQFQMANEAFRIENLRLRAELNETTKKLVICKIRNNNSS
jgi:hypothetical protein